VGSRGVVSNIEHVVAALVAAGGTLQGISGYRGYSGTGLLLSTQEGGLQQGQACVLSAAMLWVGPLTVCTHGGAMLHLLAGTFPEAVPCTLVDNCAEDLQPLLLLLLLLCCL
jgi:hypothetical protein